MKHFRVQLGSALLLACWFAGPAIAQFNQNPACQTDYNACTTKCNVTGAINRALLRDCQRQCVRERSACLTGESPPSPGTAGPATAGRAAPPSPGSAEANVVLPPLNADPTAPFTRDEAERLVAGVDRALGAAVLKTREEAQAKSRCRGGMPTTSCLEAIDAIMAQRTRANEIKAAAHLSVLEQSLALDMARLPQGGVERLRTLVDDFRKYRALEKMRNPKIPDGPLAHLQSKLGHSVDLEIDRSVNDPAVKLAFNEDRLGVDLPVKDPATRAEWLADRSTYKLKARAQQLAGKRVLFMDRTVDLEQSTRERTSIGARGSWGEPTANEIGLAFLRTLVLAGGKQTTPFESQRAGLGVIGAFTNVFRVIHVDKIGCRKSAAGYICESRMWILPFLRGSGAMVAYDTRGFGGKMMQSMTASVANPEGNVMEFEVVASANGWQAPSLVERLLATQERMLDAAQRSLDSVREGQCMSARMEGDDFGEAMTCR